MYVIYLTFFTVVMHGLLASSFSAEKEMIVSYNAVTQIKIFEVSFYLHEKGIADLPLTGRMVWPSAF